VPVLVALGTAIAAGMRFIDALAAVHYSNRRRSDAGRSLRRRCPRSCGDDWKRRSGPFDSAEFMQAPRAAKDRGRRHNFRFLEITLDSAIFGQSAEALPVADWLYCRRRIAVAAGLTQRRSPTGSRVLRRARPRRVSARGTAAGDLVLLKEPTDRTTLVRIRLDRRPTVQCWEMQCGPHDFCAGCPRSTVRRGASESIGPPLFRRLRRPIAAADHCGTRNPGQAFMALPKRYIYIINGGGGDIRGVWGGGILLVFWVVFWVGGGFVGWLGGVFF